MILSHKVRPPGLPTVTVRRNRLNSLFTELLSTHDTIGVFAAAGSGKTVQAQLFADSQEWPLAWLSVDEADRNASRLVVYLAAALACVNPEAPELVSGWLESQFLVGEVAAMLAESIPNAPLLFVLDDCENLVQADEALAALVVFLDYLPPAVRTVLLSREDLDGPVGRMLLQGRIARITGSSLALDLSEAGVLLAAHGQSERDPVQLIESTHGWIAAAAFDAVPGLQNEAGPDSLAGYLNREVLARLPVEEQHFLLRTSLPATVSAKTAAALCGQRGYALWHALASRHLPATKVDRALVYHPRFRQFLREELLAQLPDEVPELRARYAALLAEHEIFEEATEVYLEIGHTECAADAAERAVGAVAARADWAILLRWLDAFGPEVVERRPVLQGGLIRALYGVRRIPEAQTLLRQLHREGALAEITKADPGVVAFVGYIMQWHPTEALELLHNYPGDYRAEAMRYELEAVAGRSHVAPPSGVAWSVSERSFTWGLMVQGRMDQLRQMLPDDSEWPPQSIYRSPHPLIALIWQGDLPRARQLFDEVPSEIITGGHSDLWSFYESWLLWAEGRPEEALHAAEAAVDYSRRTRFGWEPCFEVVVGVAQLMLGRIDDARVTLADAVSRSASSGNRGYVEWAQTFQGLAFLMIDDHAEAAVRVLRPATQGMQEAGRLLMLPFAATYLAEAEARNGNPDAAAEAAELAYETATAMNCQFVLRRALRDVPGVLRRQLAAEASGSRWRQLLGQPERVRTRASAAAPSKEPVIVEVQTHGPTTDLIVDGVPRCSRRTKVLELAAYLTLHPEGVDRQRLQERLFPDTDPRRGGNYFRQVVHKLRQATGVNLARTDLGLVRWSDELRVDSTDLRVERSLRAVAAGPGGAEKLESLEATLALVEGPYLPESELDWAEQRRHELEVIIVDGALEAARLALQLGHLTRARDAATIAIRRDPFCEAAYCIRMRVDAQVGPANAVLAEFQRLTAALTELGVDPAPSTRELVRQLRQR